MGKQTSIQWTDASWNPWHGCEKVSPGCKFCYMFADKKRYGQDPTKVTRSSSATFNAPLKWKEPRKIFTCSWSDWFIDKADPWRDEAWDIIRRTPHHIYQILTKRPERIKDHLPADWGEGWPNVWLGVSVEDQARKHRIDTLREIPASVRFLSCEPILEDLGQLDLTGIAWVIAGGESGPGARPFDLDWGRNLIDQCAAAEVPIFVKQLGAVAVQTGKRVSLQDSKGGDWDEWPGELRVISFPLRAA